LKIQKVPGTKEENVKSVRHKEIKKGKKCPGYLEYILKEYYIT
jgi:hypothetical protein